LYHRHEGNGPNYGTPVKLGFLAASPDPLILDLVLAHLVGAEIEQVPHLRLALNDGLIPKDIGEVKIFSDRPLDEYRRNIKLPVTLTTKRGSLLSKTITTILKTWFKRLLTIKPVVAPDTCTACAVCVRACPTHAAHMTKRRDRDCANITDKL
jgi:NAD-dependent dihydropyrimidine dehydrogenase PreA subunit